MNHIYFFKEFFQALIRANLPLPGVRYGLFGVGNENSLNLNIGAMDLPETLEMKCCGKTCTNNSSANGFLFHPDLVFQIKRRDIIAVFFTGCL